MATARTTVWSQHTTYPSAAGMHSEISRQTQARQATDERLLNANLSSLQTMHHKEMQRLRQHRKSMETSMLAYSQKMRKISKDRHSILSDTHSPPPSLSTSPPVEHQQQDYSGPSALERLIVMRRTSGLPTDKNLRVSVDSGIDVNEDAPSMEDVRAKKLSSTRSWLNVQNAKQRSISLTSGSRKPRPSSFHALDADQVEQNFSNSSADMPEDTMSDITASGKRRQRRPGTFEKPDVLALKLNMQQADQASSIGLDEEHSPLPDDASEIVSITPFPESVRLSPAPDSEISSWRSGTLMRSSPHPTDEKSSSGFSTTRSSKSQSQSPLRAHKLSVNTRESYWSFRNAQKRFSIKPEKIPIKAFAQRTRPIRMKKYKAPPKAPKTTHFSSFRYSDAVKDVIRCFDESSKTAIKVTSAVRRASEILPSLDIEDLKQEIKRLREEGKLKLNASVKECAETLVNSDTDLAGDSEDVTSILAAMVRERSMSASDVLDLSSSQCGENSEDVAAKPALRKFQSTYFTEEPQSKTVQFELPAQGLTEVQNA